MKQLIVCLIFMISFLPQAFSQIKEIGGIWDLQTSNEQCYASKTVKIVFGYNNGDYWSNLRFVNRYPGDNLVITNLTPNSQANSDDFWLNLLGLENKDIYTELLSGWFGDQYTNLENKNNTLKFSVSTKPYDYPNPILAIRKLELTMESADKITISERYALGQTFKCTFIRNKIESIRLYLKNLPQNTPEDKVKYQNVLLDLKNRGFLESLQML